MSFFRNRHGLVAPSTIVGCCSDFELHVCLHFALADPRSSAYAFPSIHFLPAVFAVIDLAVRRGLHEECTQQSGPSPSYGIEVGTDERCTFIEIASIMVLSVT